MSAAVRLGDIDTRTLLKELGKFDKQLVKETRSRIVKSAKVIIRDAKKAIPAAPPMSGWRTVPATNPRTRGGAGWPACASCTRLAMPCESWFEYSPHVSGSCTFSSTRLASASGEGRPDSSP